MPRVFKIVRDTFTDLTTIGEFYLEDFWLSYCLEDKVRDPGFKIPGATAIPEGFYDLTMDFSHRFQKLMPHILEVPLFTGIRIHKGNTHLDTEGCPMLGMERGKDKIWNCAPAFDFFYELLSKFIRDKEIVKIWVTHNKGASL